MSSLSDLDANWDLKFEVDFREIYATVLDRWLEVDNEKILNKAFSQLDFI